MPIADLNECYDEMFDYVMEKTENRESSFGATLVFEELFVNIMKYAYGKDSGPVMIKMRVGDTSLDMTFIDAGKLFDPTAYYIGANMSKIGGHGIELVRTYTKTFEYTRVYDLNITRIVI